MKTKVLLGMSGGVDSTVAAQILKEKGYQVSGITFLFSNDQENSQIVERTKKLAELLKINHVVADISNHFRKSVVNYVIDEYHRGKTPFPCAVCNPQVKFYHLSKWADKLKTDYFATGHYVRKIAINKKSYIMTGLDPEKDQSFFLWGLTQKMITRALFPLGDYYKKDVWNYAAKNQLSNLIPDKESFGICFVQQNNYRDFLEKHGKTNIPGNIINEKGEILGRHDGITRYTIGQRKGLGNELNARYFVLEIKPETHEIVVGDFDQLYKNTIILNQCRFVDKKDTKTNISVRVRYRLQNTLCDIAFDGRDKIRVHLHKPLAMIAKGQTAVFYDEHRVLGGGFIVDAF